MFEIKRYVTDDGHDVFTQWLVKLKDSKARIAIDRRIVRVELGNFGDHKLCRDGVWELRIDVGPGYRVYYAQAGKVLVLLLCGGTKRTQSADIDAAVGYWKAWQRNNLGQEQKK
ncbi:MAG: type II toxin-antitoxin system RelE/ParE family toxin [Burkholderiaceae bacterium]|jgi:putative addiction module killer protein|nr:type II toxin-antitoxin system RelE/ParE family toxin [Burkholderiaceae bacterium]